MSCYLLNLVVYREANQPSRSETLVTAHGAHYRGRNVLPFLKNAANSP